MKYFTGCKPITINKKSSRQNGGEKAKTVHWQSLSWSLFVILIQRYHLTIFSGNLKCAYFQWVDMGFFNRIWADPGFVSPVRSDPGFVSPIRSDPIRSDPIRSGPVRSGPVRSGPIRSGPVRSDPGFVNRRHFIYMNILAEVKSFSLRIGDSICSLNKTQTHILILITGTKKVRKRTWTQDRFPRWTFPQHFSS